MRTVSTLQAAALAAAVGAALTAAATARAQKPAPSRYYLECFSLRSLGADINFQASQGWSVRAMVDHTGADGQECLLVLFERGGQ